MTDGEGNERNIYDPYVTSKKCVIPKSYEQIRCKNVAHLSDHKSAQCIHTKTDWVQDHIQTVAAIVGAAATLEDIEVMASLWGEFVCTTGGVNLLRLNCTH